MSSKKRSNPLKDKRLASLNASSKVLEGIESSYWDDISISLEYFCARSPNGEGQNFNEWTQSQIEDLLDKLKAFCGKTIGQLVSDGTLAIYGDYPHKSMFECPSNLPESGVSWARFRLTGKTRICGFFLKKMSNVQHDVFYLVFLDKEHRFFPSKLRHT